MIHIQHVSTQHTDTEGQFVHDMNIILDRRSNVINLTEVNKRNGWLLDASRRHNYQLFDPDPDGDCAILLKSRIKCLSAGSIPVIPGVSGPARQGGHSPRSLEYVRFMFEDSVITDAVLHLSTGYGRNKVRTENAIDQWKALGNFAHQHADGQHIVFWSMDSNWDVDDPSNNYPAQLMDDYHISTIFEELHKPQLATFGKRQIDLIGKYDHDHRVKGMDVKIWKDETFIDHEQVSAWYKIEPLA